MSKFAKIAVDLLSKIIKYSRALKKVGGNINFILLRMKDANYKKYSCYKDTI